MRNQLLVFNDYIKILEADLKERVPVFSGELRDSIKATVDYKKDEPSLSAEYLVYGEFMDKGVNGTEVDWGSEYSFREKMPPIQALEEWANAYNINPWALAKSIQKKGLEPRNFTQNVDFITEQFGSDYIVSYWDDYYEYDKNIKRK
jgi:hypothetical protein